MIYLKLFYEFFKTGLFAVGGGQATIPFLYSIAYRTSWFTIDELINMIAVSESTPGPIGVNMATYVGFTTAGVLGSVCATIGLVTPSIIIIILIASLFERFSEKPYVKTVFKYLRCASLSLMFYAVSKVAVNTFYDGTSVNITKICLCLLLIPFIVKFKKVHPVLWVLTGALLGLLFF